MSVLGPPERGGQKLVFPTEIDGKKYALKAMLTSPRTDDDEEAEDLDEVTARARREVDTMNQVDSPHLVRLGPITLTAATIAGQEVLYFSEEWIDGNSIRALVMDSGPLAVNEVVRLGIHTAEAIKVLWSLAKIHRDVKPQNVMRRDSNGDFVLLDLGLVFDLGEDSLTMFGMVAGTPFYFSPEQTEFARKRQLDFRSDLFSLGIVLYESATGTHPFWAPGLAVPEVVGRILTHTPAPPSSIRADMPNELDEVIQRLLGKQAHLRYGSCDLLIDALDRVPS